MLSKIRSHNLMSVLRCKCSGNYSKLIKCALRAALNVSIEAWSITVRYCSDYKAVLVCVGITGNRDKFLGVILPCLPFLRD